MIFRVGNNMKHRLSFASFNKITEEILEVTVDEGVKMTLEMIEECHDFIQTHFTGNLGLLVNKINDYSYTYEAQLSVASYEKMKAIAFVCYSDESQITTLKLCNARVADNWNFRLFSGLDVGWEQAYNWIGEELTK